MTLYGGTSALEAGCGIATLNRGGLTVGTGTGAGAGVGVGPGTGFKVLLFEVLKLTMLGVMTRGVCVHILVALRYYYSTYQLVAKLLAPVLLLALAHRVCCVLQVIK